MEVTKEQAKAYTEVIEILKYVPKEDVEKISKDKLKFYQENMDIEYDFKIDVNKNFEEQELSKTAKIILAIIFRDYWATPKQREKILKKEKYDMQQLELKKQKNYDTSDLFKKKKEIQSNLDETQLVVYKEEKWYTGFINFIKKIFNRNKMK